MDYNIYIHTDEEGNASRTRAWGSSEGEKIGGESQTNAWVPKAQKAISAVGNPDSLISRGVGAVAKAVPWVAVAYAVVKVATFAVDTATQFATTATGDYSFQTGWDNFKNIVHVTLTPFTTTINYFKRNQQYKRMNERNAAHLDLLGDSVINTYTDRGC